jgi:cytoskeletal protein CcmA (bactofilin family)
MLNAMNKTTGSIDANAETVVHALKLVGGNVGKVVVQIAGSFTGTMELEATVDGSTWAAYYLIPNNNTTPATQFTAAGIWVGDAFALHSVRLRASAWTTGTANITIQSI